MTEPSFQAEAVPLTVGDIARMTGAVPGSGAKLGRIITNIASLDRAGPSDVTFLQSAKHLDVLPRSRAGVCLLAQRFDTYATNDLCILISRDPYRDFVTVAQALFPGALRPSTPFAVSGVSTDASVHASARLENGVSVDPGVVIGPAAEIGSGTRIGANAVIGASVRVGRDCSIGAGSTLTHVLIGDRVIVHPGAYIGQAGCGSAGGAEDFTKVPQIGRVIIQDDVVVGAGTTIDRGTIQDTVIGEGTKIDNQVQIGHNAEIGRYCMIVAQSGISGSAKLGDHVTLGARVGVMAHISIGEGAQLAPGSSVVADVPPGARWGGSSFEEP